MKRIILLTLTVTIVSAYANNTPKEEDYVGKYCSHKRE